MKCVCSVTDTKSLPTRCLAALWQNADTRKNPIARVTIHALVETARKRLYDAPEHNLESFSRRMLSSVAWLRRLQCCSQPRQPQGPLSKGTTAGRGTACAWRKVAKMAAVND